MDLEQILVVTLSGVRPEEETAVQALLADSILPVSDLTSEKLRHFLVARKGDLVVGTVGLELFPPHGLLRSLAVDEAHRGQGIAAKLLTAIEQYARMMEVDTLYLLTPTAADFFSQREFTKTSRREAPQSLLATEEFKTLCPDTAVCMQKRLS